MTRSVAILAFDEMEALDFAGPFEVFTTAARVARRWGEESPFEVLSVSDAERVRARTARAGRVPPGPERVRALFQGIKDWIDDPDLPGGCPITGACIEFDDRDGPVREALARLQRLGVRFEVTEATLNHVSGAKGGVAGIYQRHDWREEKRSALDAWARHVAAILKPEIGGNVVPLRA